MFKKLIAILLAFYATASIAVTATDKAFEADFLKRFPYAVGAVIKPAFKGFYSVVKGQDLFYISDDMNTIVKGDVTDLKTGVNLTKKLSYQALPRVSSATLSKLDIRNAIQFGSGTKSLYVFSDPDCTYCRQLQSEIGKLKGVTVYVFPLPISELHPRATDVAISIWCSSDKTKAWDDYLLKRIAPTDAKCMNPVSTNKAYAEKLAIYGTPTIIFPDGRMLPSAASASDLLSELDSQ